MRLRRASDLELDGIEFSALPSGLHLVDQDVVYVSCVHIAPPLIRVGSGTSRRELILECAFSVDGRPLNKATAGLG